MSAQRVPQSEIDNFTVRLHAVLTHPKTAPSVVNAIGRILSEMANESQVFIDHPDIIAVAFPVMFTNLNEQYARGMMDSIDALTYSCVALDGDLNKHAEEMKEGTR